MIGFIGLSDDFFNNNLLENSILDCIFFCLFLILAITFKKIFSKLLSRILYRFFKKYSSEITVKNFDFLLSKPLRLFILITIGYFAFSFLKFPANWHLANETEFGIKMLLKRGYYILLIYSIIMISLRIIDAIGIILVRRYENESAKMNEQLIRFAVDSMKVVAVTLGVFIILGAVFNVNIDSLISGLWIGGLAIALAAKETLENLLGSFTIFLDKPFVVGDFISIGTTSGSVEKIGFRSTRIRTVEKSFLTIPNKKLVDSELENISLRTHRRVFFNLKLSFDSTIEQINIILKQSQKLIDEHKSTTKEGSIKFEGFNDNGFTIRVEYFVDTKDWDFYLNIREEINLEILKIVTNNKCSLACPTREIYIHK